MARTAQVLHLAESPNDSFLLKAELAEEGIACQLLALSPGEDLARAVAGSQHRSDRRRRAPQLAGLAQRPRRNPADAARAARRVPLGRHRQLVDGVVDRAARTPHPRRAVAARHAQAHRRRAPRVPGSAGASSADLSRAAALRLLELRRGHQADHRARRRPARSRARQRLGVHRGSQGHRLPRPVRALDADPRAAAAGVVVSALPGDARVVADAGRRRRAARSADQRAGRIVPGAARGRVDARRADPPRRTPRRRRVPRADRDRRTSGRCSSSAAPAGWRASWRGRWTSASAGSWPIASSAPSGSTRSDGWPAASPTTSTTASPRSSATSIRACTARTARRAPRSPTSARSR